MLRILGTRKSLCDRLTRREMLEAGGLSAAGLSLADFLHLREAGANVSSTLPAGSFGKAKNCILLYLWGSPSQLETFDVKPDAPRDVRGEFGDGIATSIPGYRVGELLPQISQEMHKVTVVRSLTHPYPLHGIELALTGIPKLGQRFSNPHDTRSWPFIGSVVEYLQEQQSNSAHSEIPNNIALPWPFSSRRTGEVLRSGPYGGFLGSAYDPVWTEFDGTASDSSPTVHASFGGINKSYRDPYGGITPDSSFLMAANGKLRPEMTLNRLDRRRSLLTQLDQSRRQADQQIDRSSFDRFQQMAFSMLTSPKLSEAIDIDREPSETRERYGMSLFGQGCLAARRLIEAGSTFVTVFWDEYESVNSAWDTHEDHFNRMTNQLCPNFDTAFPALLRDLSERQLLDETMVVCISEHGRTPKIDNSPGGGRNHWSRAYSALFAGGGFAEGRVIGRTDAVAGDVESSPFHPNDILATIYHLLGIDPHTTLHDRLGRPLPLVGAGSVRQELLA